MNHNENRRAILSDIVEYLKNEKDEAAAVIEALSAETGAYDDDIFFDMEMLPEMLDSSDIIGNLNRAFFGRDLDTWHTDSHGGKEFAAFNPNRSYFRFDGYGNLESTNYKDYTDIIDTYTAEMLIEHRIDIAEALSDTLSDWLEDIAQDID